MIPLTRHGWREMLIGTLVLLALGAGLAWIWPFLGLLVLPVIIWLFAFFRDPERPITTEADALVSPADGLVSDITSIEHDPLLGGPALRIGIFLSVFNVHVNRSPCPGRVERVIYKKGKFINALHHGEASDQNESNTLLMVDPATGRPIAAVKQIVGLIARRIICEPKGGEVLARGQRFGMIKFGSRTELYIPRWLDPVSSVQVGQKVRGGMDIIARAHLDRASTTHAEPAAAPARA